MKIKRVLHSKIIKFIAWYLRDRCGGASHVYPYGRDGRYIVMMNEKQYNEYTNKIEDRFL